MVAIPQNGRPPPAFRWAILSLLFLAASSILSVTARSPHPPPLRRLHHPSARSLEILPRRKTDSIAHSYYARAPFPHPRTLRHDDSFFLTLDLPSLLPQPVHLLMKPTVDLFHPDAVIRYDSGITEPLLAQDYRLYTGEVVKANWKDRLYWEETTGLRDTEMKDGVMGDARIMVLHPGSKDVHPIFEGVFTVNGIHYNVLTKEHYDRVKTNKDVVSEEFEDMVVFRNADAWHDTPPAQTAFSSCSHDELPFNANTSHPVRSGMTHDDMLNNIFKRDDLGGMAPSSNYVNSIGNPAGCPSTQQVVYMGVALDCNYVQTYGSTERAREQVLNVWNQVSALYRSTFNISLGIVELVVQNTTCPTQAQQGSEWDVDCDANLTLDQRLSLFSQWRGNRGDDGVGLWHLMSACPTDTEVGVAWLGTLCQTTSNFQSGSYVSGTGISTATRTEWSLVAHEIGHGFGAIHDCTSGCSLSGSCCPLNSGTCDAGGRFIMNPTTSETEETFSQCTLGNICSGLGSRLVSSSCVQTPGGRTTISLQQCGNGIVDDGEQCDPGSNGDSTCCDPQTCQFRSGAVCDPSNAACCTDSCQFAAAGTVCRQAVQATCDFAETCTGGNATCPPDRTADDGTSCGDGLSCASGRCTSLDQQCQTAGASMNLTQACGQRDDTSCVVACRDPRIPNQCVVLQTPLVDGSPCGYGGHCYNQTCESGSWQSTAGAWYRQNLQISIPVTVVAGLLVLGILFAIVRCIMRGCCGGGRRNNNNNNRNRQSMRQSGMGGGAAFPPPPQRNSDSSTAAMNRPPPPPPNRQSGYENVPAGSPPRAPAPTHQYDYGNGYGNDGYANGGGGYGNGGYEGYNNPYSQQGSGPGWVDERMYNGQNYGRQEAWGR